MVHWKWISGVSKWGEIGVPSHHPRTFVRRVHKSPRSRTAEQHRTPTSLLLWISHNPLVRIRIPAASQPVSHIPTAPTRDLI